jgi:tRNA pseudouridine55 synthase
MNGPGSADGIVLVDKPAGITSHGVVERVRHGALASGRKVGHAGTLDPFATGLLVLLVGRATRVQRFFMSMSKTYRAVAAFGARSDTGDPTGKIESTGCSASAEGLSAALPRLTGEIQQRVPLTSAVKVGGERLYRKARRGERFETPVRPVTVSSLHLVEFDQPSQRAVLEVECSSGTYVRQLVADLGELCETGAYCAELERLSVGPLRVEDADEERLIPLSKALDFMPERRLTAEEARQVGHGISVPAAEQAPEGEAVRLTRGDLVVAVAQRRNGFLKPVTVFADV